MSLTYQDGRLIFTFGPHTRIGRVFGQYAGLLEEAFHIGASTGIMDAVYRDFHNAVDPEWQKKESTLRNSLLHFVKSTDPQNFEQYKQTVEARRLLEKEIRESPTKLVPRQDSNSALDTYLSIMTEELLNYLETRLNLTYRKLALKKGDAMEASFKALSLEVEAQYSGIAGSEEIVKEARKLDADANLQYERLKKPDEKMSYILGRLASDAVTLIIETPQGQSYEL